MLKIQGESSGGFCDGVSRRNFLQIGSLAMGGIARVGQVQLLQIFVTVALSAMLLGETITVRTLLFATAVAAIVWFGRRARIA